MANVLILNRDKEGTINGAADSIASNALSAMVKALGHTSTISTLRDLGETLPENTQYVFFYPDLIQMMTMERFMRAHPETTFIMTTASAKDRSFSPNAGDEHTFDNVKVLPRPFSVDTLKGILNNR